VLCKTLGLAKSTYYNKPKQPEIFTEFESIIYDAFMNNREIYGTRKLKAYIEKHHTLSFSRKRISNTMKKFNLVSKYTKAHYKVHKSSCNEALIENVLNRDFEKPQPEKVIVTDLTYVRVGDKWHYVCLILDLFNREIVGWSCGPRKDSKLVLEAFSRVKFPLTNIDIFHTDRGKEFDNQDIEEILIAFDIIRSLSKKGNPYDNAVAETTYKSLKVEFVFERHFNTLKQLEVELFDYINWWNNHRLHGYLNYMTPIEFKKQQILLPAKQY
jgi:transposase InsO family protein